MKFRKKPVVIDAIQFDGSWESLRDVERFAGTRFGGRGNGVLWTFTIPTLEGEHVRCAVCGVRFRFVGLTMGLDPSRPTVSVDEFELRAPIEPDAHLTTLMAGEDTGFPGSSNGQ